MYCSRRSFVGWAALASAGAVLGVTGCAKQETPEPTDIEGEPDETDEQSLSSLTIRLDGVPRAEHAGLFLACTRGAFADAHIDMALEEGDTEEHALDGVQAAEYPYAVASQKTLARAFGGDEPYSVLAVAALVQPESADAGYPLVLVANDSYLLHRAEETSTVLEAIREGYRFAFEHPAEAAEELAEPLGMEVARIEAELERLAAAAADSAAHEWGRIDQATWDACFIRELQAGHIDNKIPAHHGYSMDYLDDAGK